MHCTICSEKKKALISCMCTTQLICANFHIMQKAGSFILHLIYYIPDKKKKRNSKISPLSFPFNAKTLIVINTKFDQISPKLECGVDEYLCFPCLGTKRIKEYGKQVLEVFIQWYCLRGIPSMLCSGNVRKRYVFVM